MLPGKYHAVVDRTSRDEWADLLELFADASIYQTWPYGEIRWGRRALSHCVLYRGSEVVAIAQLRIAPRWGIRCGIAYLRWGPLYVRRQDNGSDAEVLSAMIRALHDEYTVKRGLFLRILPNSYAGTPQARDFEQSFPAFKKEVFTEGTTYRTLLLDLQPDLAELRKGLDQKWRNQLNRAEKNNLRIVTGDSPATIEIFIRLYEEMLARKKFATFSDIREFAKMQDLLTGRQRLKILICEENGAPVSGVVATAMGNTGIYLFGATSDKGMNSKGAYLLQWEVVRWLKESGFRYYNLGGINPATNPGVYHFKSGLSGRDLQYIQPYSECENVFSSVFVNAGECLRNSARYIKRKTAVLLVPKALEKKIAKGPEPEKKEADRVKIWSFG